MVNSVWRYSSALISVSLLLSVIPASAQWQTIVLDGGTGCPGVQTVSSLASVSPMQQGILCTITDGDGDVDCDNGTGTTTQLCLNADGTSTGWIALADITQTGSVAEWSDEGNTLRPADASDDWVRMAGDTAAPRWGAPTSGVAVLDTDNDGLAEFSVDTAEVVINADIDMSGSGFGNAGAPNINFNSATPSGIFYTEFFTIPIVATTVNSVTAQQWLAQYTRMTVPAAILTSSTAYDTLLVQSDNTSADRTLTTFRHRNDGADDAAFDVRFELYDDNSDWQGAVRDTYILTDTANTVADGGRRTFIYSDGTEYEVLRLESVDGQGGVTVNAAGEDIDFTVNTDGVSSALFCTGSNDTCGVAANATFSINGTLQATTATLTGPVTFNSSAPTFNAGATFNNAAATFNAAATHTGGTWVLDTDGRVNDGRQLAWGTGSDVAAEYDGTNDVLSFVLGNSVTTGMYDVGGFAMQTWVGDRATPASYTQLNFNGSKRLKTTVSNANEVGLQLGSAGTSCKLLSTDTSGDIQCGGSVTMGTNTDGAYVATLADAGNGTVSVGGTPASGQESAAITLDVTGVNCNGCLDTTQIDDVFVRKTSNQTMAGSLTTTGTHIEIETDTPFLRLDNTTDATDATVIYFEESGSNQARLQYTGSQAVTNGNELRLECVNSGCEVVFTTGTNAESLRLGSNHAATFTGAVSASSLAGGNVTSGTDPGHSHTDTSISGFLPLGGGTMTGGINMNGHTVTNVANGTVSAPSLTWQNGNAGLYAPASGSIGVTNNGTSTIQFNASNIEVGRNADFNNAEVQDVAAITFLEDNGDPACAAGDYNIYARLSDATLMKCVNGTRSVLDGTVFSNGATFNGGLVTIATGVRVTDDIDFNFGNSDDIGFSWSSTNDELVIAQVDGSESVWQDAGPNDILRINADSSSGSTVKLYGGGQLRLTTTPTVTGAQTGLQLGTTGQSCNFLYTNAAGRVLCETADNVGDDVSVNGTAAVDANLVDSTEITFTLNGTPTPNEIKANIECQDCLGKVEIADVYVLNESSGDTMNGPLVISTQAQATSGALQAQNTQDAATIETVRFYGAQRVTPADNDMAVLSLWNEASNGFQAPTVALRWKITDVTSTSRDGELSFAVASNETSSFVTDLNEQMAIDGNGVRTTNNLTVNGTLNQVNGTLRFNDNNQLRFGNGDDITIEWDAATDELQIAQADNSEAFWRDSGSNDIVKIESNTSSGSTVNLYAGGQLRLGTSTVTTSGKTGLLLGAAAQSCNYLSTTSTGDLVCQASATVGDSITVGQTAAVDPDFVNTGEIAFSLNTGVSPHQITANIDCQDCINETEIQDRYVFNIAAGDVMTGPLTITTQNAATSGALQAQNTQDANTVETVRLYGSDRATPATDDTAVFSLWNETNAGVQSPTVALRWKITDVSSTSRDGEFVVAVASDETSSDVADLNDQLAIDKNGVRTVNNLTVNGTLNQVNGALRFNDDNQLRFGNGNDLTVEWDAATDELQIVQANNSEAFWRDTGNNDIVKIESNTSSGSTINLYANGQLRLGTSTVTTGNRTGLELGAAAQSCNFLSTTSTGGLVCETTSTLGDNISVKGTAATDANFVDSAEIAFTLNTGVAPNQVTAEIVCNNCLDETEIKDRYVSNQNAGDIMLGPLNITTQNAATTGALQIQNTEDQSIVEAARFYGAARSAPADGDAALFTLFNENDQGVQAPSVSFMWKILDVTNTSRDGELVIAVASDESTADIGNLNGQLTINANGVRTDNNLTVNGNLNQVNGTLRFNDDNQLRLGTGNDLTVEWDAAADELQIVQANNSEAFWRDTGNNDIVKIESNTSSGSTVNLYADGQLRLGTSTVTTGNRTGLELGAAAQSCNFLSTTSTGGLVCETTSTFGDNILVAGTAATDANFVNTGDVSFSLNTGVAPNEIQANIDGALHLEESGAAVLLVQRVDNNTTTGGDVAQFYGPARSAGTDNDNGFNSYWLDDDLGAPRPFAAMQWIADDVTSTSKDGRMVFAVAENMGTSQTAVGDLTAKMEIRAAGVLFNDQVVLSGASNVINGSTSLLDSVPFNIGTGADIVLKYTNTSPQRQATFTIADTNAVSWADDAANQIVRIEGNSSGNDSHVELYYDNELRMQTESVSATQVGVKFGTAGQDCGYLYTSASGSLLCGDSPIPLMGQWQTGPLGGALSTSLQESTSEAACIRYFLPGRMAGIDRAAVYFNTGNATNKTEVGVFSADGQTKYFECTFADNRPNQQVSDCTNDDTTPDAVPAGNVWVCLTFANSSTELHGTHGLGASLQYCAHSQSATGGEMPDTLTASPSCTWAATRPAYVSLQDR